MSPITGLEVRYSVLRVILIGPITAFAEFDMKIAEIEAARIDAKVKDAVDLLRNYRRQYDEKRDVFFDKPVHDFTSHAADSFRYLAVGLNETDDGWDKPLEINKSWIV